MDGMPITIRVWTSGGPSSAEPDHVFERLSPGDTAEFELGVDQGWSDHSERDRVEGQSMFTWTVEGHGDRAGPFAKAVIEMFGERRKFHVDEHAEPKVGQCPDPVVEMQYLGKPSEV